MATEYETNVEADVYEPRELPEGDYIPELRDEDKRKATCTHWSALINRSQSAAKYAEVDIVRKLRDGQDYYFSRQPIKGVRFNDYRDKTVYRNILTRHALLSSNDPRPSFMPREPQDAPLAKVIRRVDDYYWEKMRGSLKYRLMLQDSLKFSAGFWFIDFEQDTPEIIVPTLAEVGVADWTEFDIAQQPFIYRVVTMPVEEAEERWPHLDTLDPEAVDGDALALLNELYSNYKTLSGSEVLQSDAKSTYKAGNLICYEFWYKNAEGTVYRAYIVNGKLAECIETDYPCYPIMAWRNRPCNGAFLGISEAEISRDISDSRTSLMHSMLFHDALFGKPTVEFDESTGYDAAEIKKVFERPGTAVPVPHNVYQQGSGMRFIQPQPMPATKLQLLEITDEIGDNESGRTKWLEGTAAAGSDPASKVSYLQAAGMQQIKSQAKTNDQDGLYRYGTLMLWYYQTRLTQPMVIRIVGEKLPDGSPMFIDVNMEIQKAMLDELMGAAAQAGDRDRVKLGNTVFTPAEILQQVELIHDRIAKTGAVDTVKLNDLSVGRFDISIQDSDALPYNETQKKNVMAIGLSAGVVSPVEWRDTYGLDTSEAAIEALPITQQMRAQQQMAAQHEAQAAAQMEAQQAGLQPAAAQPQAQQMVPSGPTVQGAM